MTDEIRKLRDTQLFMPFTVNVADGREFFVPTRDHIHINPGGRRITIYTDKGLVAFLPAMLISGLTLKDPQPEPSV